jgi:hypothetical protein
MPSQIQKHAQATALTKLHQILIDHQDTYLSTVDLLELEIFSPASGIARIKTTGVSIDTIYQSITDQDGNVHPRVAFYKIVDGGAS